MNQLDSVLAGEGAQDSRAFEHGAISQTLDWQVEDRDGSGLQLRDALATWAKRRDVNLEPCWIQISGELDKVPFIAADVELENDQKNRDRPGQDST